MGLLTQFSNYQYADFARKPVEIGIPHTASNTLQDVNTTLSRVPRFELERLYREDAQTFKTVNSYKQLLVQAGYRILADNTTNQKQYDRFFEEIGKIGLHYKLEQLMERIIHDCILYGHAYVERVYNLDGTRIVDLKPVDAKLMDYVRDMKYMLMTDLEQNPLGYVMNCNYYSDAIGDMYPKDARVLPGYVFLRPERIACFVLSPYGNGFEGMGLIEPAYKQITRKMKIEEAASNAIYNASDSLIYAIVGDAQRSAPEPVKNATLNTLINWKTNRRAVFQYPTTINSLPVEQSPQVQEMLQYLREDQATAAGMSMSLAIGSGQDNNKSTMNTERKDFNTKLNAVAKDLSEQFTTKILDPIYKVNGYGSKAILQWNDVSVDDKTDMVGLMMQLFEMGSIAPSEVRGYAKNVLNLETNEEAYKEFKLSTQYLPGMANPTEGSPIKTDDTEVNVVSGSGKLLATKKGKQTKQVEKNIDSSKEGYEETRE